MKRKVEIKTDVKKDEESKFVQRVRLSSRWMIPHLAHPEISVYLQTHGYYTQYRLVQVDNIKIAVEM